MASFVAAFDNGAINISSVASWQATGVTLIAGETVLVAVGYGSLGTATNRAITLADNLGNTYNEITLPADQFYAPNAAGIRIFKCQVTTGGTATITATPDANCDYTNICGYRFNGGTTTGDGANCVRTNSATPSAGGITTTTNGAIVAGFLVNTSAAAGTLTTPNGSFGDVLNISGGGTAGQCQIQASAGAIDSQPTMSQSGNWLSAIVALQAVAGATYIPRGMLLGAG